MPSRASIRCRDPHLRLKDMETDGVDAEVIYGILGTASKLNDREASNEVLRIYNDWLKEFCSHYPDRHIGLACLPYGNVEEAVAEVKRDGQDGAARPRTVVLMGHGADVAPGVGAVVEGGRRCRPAIAFPYLPDDRAASRTEERQVQRAAMFTGVSAFQMGLVHIMAGMMGAGVFERHPNLRIGFGESGVGWIPYALHRMDFEFEDRFRDLMKLKPSRILAPPVPRDLPVRPDRRQADRRYRRRDHHVGLGLPAYRRRLAGIAEIHRRAVRRPVAGGDPQDHLRERRQVLPPVELGEAAMTPLSRRERGRAKRGG